MLRELFYDKAVRQVLCEFPTGHRESAEFQKHPIIISYLLGCTFNECRASTAESKTFEEWAPSLKESLIEYSLSDFSLPPFRS